MSNIFKKADIKAGYLLRVKNTKTGDEFNMTVVPTSKANFSVLVKLLLNEEDREAGALAVCTPGEHWWSLGCFDDGLVYIDTYKVVAIYGYTCPKFLLNNSTEDRELLWEREAEQATEDTQPEPKKMTVDEIIKALGYPVEIVEG